MRTLTYKHIGAIAATTLGFVQGCSSDSSVAGRAGQAGSSDPESPTAANTATGRGEAPVVQVELTTTLAPRASISPASSAGSSNAANEAVVAKVTLTKSAIFGRDFLYGADLQYSAKRDAEFDLTLQSLALGHDIARFHVVGKDLQLVATQNHLFESDVNHPERLIHAFKIVRETASTLTIEVSRGSDTLASVVEGAAAAPERTSWVRNVSYVPASQLFMFASSIESGKGDLYEFMESLSPRDALVPSSYTPLSANPDDEPLAARFGFLSAGAVFTGEPGTRTKTQFATRFLADSASAAPVAWYVTPNIQEQYLADVKTGVEAWNRYSQAMWGKDLLSFKGRLPAGISIGDPRYNVINWDNVADAGAAYESQASDPLTGIQSHSLIYMPLAWVNIGKTYWERGELSEALTGSATTIQNQLKGKQFLGRDVHLNCLRGVASRVSLEARESPEEFARGLLKGVVFHEVGHALGLAHNFKGSLSMDGTKDSQFSSSIMDYNSYALERAAFTSVPSASGPLLEYDRQAISALYNEAKDIKPTDPVLPTCEDAVADDVAGGVDPLCIRYDEGSNPAARALATTRLLTDESFTLGTTLSLAKALRQSSSKLPSQAGIATVKDGQDALTKFATTVRGVVRYYVLTNTNGLVADTAKLLYVYKPDTLPETLNEAALRETQFAAVEFTASLETLPAASSDALNSAVAAAKAWFEGTPGFVGLPVGAQDAAKTAAYAALDGLRPAIEGATNLAVLSRLRRGVLGALVRIPTAPFAYSAAAGVDYEAKALALLERGLLTQLGGKPRPDLERATYIATMRSFLDTPGGQAARSRVDTQLQAELNAAPDAASRETLRSLLKDLRAD